MLTRFRNWVKSLLSPGTPTSEEIWEYLRAREGMGSEQEIWESLVEKDICPVCQKQGELNLYARGGAAENWICLNCKTRYWLTPVEGCRFMGARILS